MSTDSYLSHLRNIDIAIFNHKRQQGMGNIIALLGLGKKVYMRKDVSSWMFLEKMGVKVFSIDSFDLSPVSEKDMEGNRLIIKSYFSSGSLKNQLLSIFAK